MIRNADGKDFDEIFDVINDAARAYKGIIPDDRWHDPYMSQAELRTQIDEGVVFSCYEDEGQILGVMGLQDRGEVFLIRHAYVRSDNRNRGIGTLLLKEISSGVRKPLLIGTWKAADWAIRFYVRNGFFVLPEDEKDILLRKYWTIPERQVETSVVLADARFRQPRL